MSKTKTFTQRNNAKRAAENMIAAGTAPSIDYKLHERQEDGRLEIVWKTEPPEPAAEPDPAPVQLNSSRKLVFVLVSKSSASWRSVQLARGLAREAVHHVPPFHGRPIRDHSCRKALRRNKILLAR
jgi:hypothetical protein